MTAGTSDDLRELVRDGFVRYGRESYSFEQRRSALGSALGFRADAWQEYSDLGWLALRLPEKNGGLGADAEMVGSLMETVGRDLLLEPLYASAVVGTLAVLGADAAVQAELLPALATGAVKLAFAHDGGATVREGKLSGRKIGVLHGDVADQLIVSASEQKVGLYLVDMAAAGVSRKSYRLVDGRGAAIVDFDKVAVRRLGGPSELQAVLDDSTVALCAEALGSVDRLVETTAAYLKVRKQFGRLLGSYQSLQHRMSEMALLREEIRALTTAAQRALQAGVGARARTISGAAAYVIGALRTIANDAVQLHGGIGVTEELEISHHFRRLMVITALLGGRDAQLERFAHSLAAAGHGADQ